MKIAFLHMTLGLANRGSERAVDLVASALAPDHEVLVLQAGPVLEKSYKVERIYDLDRTPAPAPVHLMDKILFRLGQDPAARLVKGFTHTALDSVAAFRPDIIVAVNGGVQVRILKYTFPNTPVVVFGHAGIGHDDLRNLKAGPALFVALTEEAEKWAKENAPQITKVVHIPNPITLSLDPTPPVSLNLPEPVVLTVGALTKYKNIPSVIQAVSRLNVSYVLIGEGEAEGEIAGSLSKLPGQFRWIRSVPPEEIAGYYQAVNVFCFVPDPQEAFGLVYLEAMAAGLPIVASDDPIRRKLIGPNGFFADPHDPDSISAQILLAVQKEKVDYSEELKAYDAEKVVVRIEKEFHALI